MKCFLLSSSSHPKPTEQTLGLWPVLPTWLIRLAELTYPPGGEGAWGALQPSSLVEAKEKRIRFKRRWRGRGRRVERVEEEERGPGRREKGLGWDKRDR